MARLQQPHDEVVLMPEDQGDDHAGLGHLQKEKEAVLTAFPPNLHAKCKHDRKKLHLPEWQICLHFCNLISCTEAHFFAHFLLLT